MTLLTDTCSLGKEKKQRVPVSGIRGGGGFTLLEVVIALAILGIGLGVILPGIGLSLRMRRDAADSVRLGIAAEQVLGELSQRTKAPAENEEGEAGGCRWLLEPLDVEIGGGIGAGNVVEAGRGAELVAVRLTVSVPDGPRWELTTLLPRGKPETNP
jgi:prepilin-type N-terminal cleavage/methylation domain-containing protein